MVSLALPCQHLYPHYISPMKWGPGAWAFLESKFQWEDTWTSSVPDSELDRVSAAVANAKSQEHTFLIGCNDPEIHAARESNLMELVALQHDNDKKYLRLMMHVLPGELCRQSFHAYLQKTPPIEGESRGKWLYDLHNDVNRRKQIAIQKNTLNAYRKEHEKSANMMWTQEEPEVDRASWEYPQDMAREKWTKSRAHLMTPEQRESIITFRAVQIYLDNPVTKDMHWNGLDSLNRFFQQQNINEPLGILRLISVRLCVIAVMNSGNVYVYFPVNDTIYTYRYPMHSESRAATPAANSIRLYRSDTHRYTRIEYITDVAGSHQSVTIDIELELVYPMNSSTASQLIEQAKSNTPIPLPLDQTYMHVVRVAGCHAGNVSILKIARSRSNKHIVYVRHNPYQLLRTRRGANTQAIPSCMYLHQDMTLSDLVQFTLSDTKKKMDAQLQMQDCHDCAAPGDSASSYSSSSSTAGNNGVTFCSVKECQSTIFAERSVMQENANRMRREYEQLAETEKGLLEKQHQHQQQQQQQQQQQDPQQPPVAKPEPDIQIEDVRQRGRELKHEVEVTERCVRIMDACMNAQDIKAGDFELHMLEDHFVPGVVLYHKPSSTFAFVSLDCENTKHTEPLLFEGLMCLGRLKERVRNGETRVTDVKIALNEGFGYDPGEEGMATGSHIPGLTPCAIKNHGQANLAVNQYISLTSS